MSERRKEFLSTYLTTFQDGRVEITGETKDLIEARVLWDDDDEYQSFRWCVTEVVLPDMECLVIAEFLKSKGLIDVDCIILSRRELFDRMVKEANVRWSFERFERLLEDLLSVHVPIIEDGREVDALWIHE